MVPRWVGLCILLPIASFASDGFALGAELSESSSSSVVYDAVAITDKLNNAVADGLEYGFLLATFLAIATISVGLIASAINRSVGG